jgi:hypothetical protein
VDEIEQGLHLCLDLSMPHIPFERFLHSDGGGLLDIVDLDFPRLLIEDRQFPRNLTVISDHLPSFVAPRAS